ncbi:hypothetical protein H4R18_004470 [Coemansia javaensis]|uniref:RNA polymerase II-associated protein 1 N-terminal domain-containing protein n=1 Tax=Coemansia javaensis TaxID=2761396 RepID=A0A9W8H9C2_9FUNG|nr:hypothetical protein H4R18_004470 [Coemansia javaensis]
MGDGSENARMHRGICRPGLGPGGGDADEDLEAMQREFFESKSRPAAQVIRRGQPPEVSGACQTSAGSVTRSEGAETARATTSGGDILDFARRMGDAIKEFEVRERTASGQAEAEAAGSAAAQPARTGAKKLSLFAQRRLAKQEQQGSGSDKVPGAGTVGSGSAATFLPKLMAPISERQGLGPAMPPQPVPRHTGFPDIPVDFPGAQQTRGGGNPEAAPEAGREAGSQTAESWARIREQISSENKSRIESMSDAAIQEAQEEIRGALSSETIERLIQRRQAARGGEGGTSSPAKPTKQVRFAAPEPDAEASGAADAQLDPLVPPAPEWVEEGDGDEEGTAAAGYFNVDDNGTGDDGSGFYANVKRKHYPPEALEDAQLAWMLGHRQAKSPMERALSGSRARESKAAASRVAAPPGDGEGDEDLMQRPVSHIRFAFDGQILAEEADVPVGAGLHHHGDDPDKPGYTIPELLHLSRSTVPAQRAVALATLGTIVHKVNVGAWDLAQSAEVYAGLLDWQAELYFAHGISDQSKTGRTEAIIALWLWVVETARYKTLVRLANGGQTEALDSTPLPGPEVSVLPKSVVATGALVEQTFKALGSMLSTRFMDAACDVVSHSLAPDQQLTMVAECVKTLMGAAPEFDECIRAHGRLLVVLQNRFPHLMGA